MTHPSPQRRPARLGALVLAPLSLALTVATAGPAHAEGDATTADITGWWTFRTAPFGDATCELSGRMEIRPAPDGEDYVCAFTTDQMCVGDLLYQSEQSCAAQELNGAILITSQVDAAYPEEVAAHYYRDNFVLDDVSSEAMSGHLSSLSVVPVRFWRESGAIS